VESEYDILPKEAYDYLDRSGALFGTPIERLAKMNIGAIELYADHGIDLYSEYLEIAVCAQHCNGGVTVDRNWQTEVEGLYCAGEAAGTFGVYRPGGSALNSTQVGSLRAAEHIARQGTAQRPAPAYSLPRLRRGRSNVASLLRELQTDMSRVADFDRSTAGMKALLSKVEGLYASFFDTVRIGEDSETAEAFRLYDTVLTQRAVLSAMICSAEAIGTHGSALVDGKPDRTGGIPRPTRTLTAGNESVLTPVTPMPDPELWFETLLARKKQEMEYGKQT
jgi:succinate dehydrogenase/fumarate reductase flavoprotein subunit